MKQNQIVSTKWIETKLMIVFERCMRVDILLRTVRKQEEWNTGEKKKEEKNQNNEGKINKVLSLERKREWKKRKKKREWKRGCFYYFIVEKATVSKYSISTVSFAVVSPNVGPSLNFSFLFYFGRSVTLLTE